MQERRFVVYSAIVGYCLLNPTYGWVITAIVFPLQQSNAVFAFTHLIALAVGLVVLRPVVRKIVRGTLTISFC